MKFLKNIVISILIGALLLPEISVTVTKEVKAESNSNVTYQHFLKTSGTLLKDNYGNGNTVCLKGVNAGGYMLQEIWMCPTISSTNVADQTDILSTLLSRFGSSKAKTLIDTYENNYWKESDFDNCVNLGMNCIRLPLWYRNFVDENGNWYSDAFERVDWFVQEAGERGLYVIIDMHGAYGSQNGSDTSGVDGGDDKYGASEFFFGDNAASNQEKYYKMWEKIARHFNGNPVVAGYDLLNEPYSTYRYSSSVNEATLRKNLWDIYDTAYSRIRAIDTDHIIIMEATWWPDDLPNPNGGSNTANGVDSTYNWSNVMYQYHQYQYGSDNDVDAQISALSGKIQNIQDHATEYNVPSFIGEFNMFSATDSWNQGMALLNNSGLNWCLWNYKATYSGSYNNWGIYNQNIEKADLENDTYETILSKWSNVGTSVLNTNISSYLQLSSTSLGDLGQAQISSSLIPGASATGQTESIDVSVTPLAGMPYDTQYYVYLDGSSTPAKIITPRIQAEEWSEQNGVVYDRNKTDSDGNTINNVGGTNNGDWTKYSNINFGTGTGEEITARYAASYSSVGSNPKLEIYIDSMDSSNLAGTLYLEKTEGESWSNYKLGSAVLDNSITGTHDVYIKYVVDSSNVCNLDWFQFSSQPVNACTDTLTGISAGTHSVTVKAYLDGAFSGGTTVSDIKVYAQPQKIASVSATRSGTSIHAQWASANDTSYEAKLLDADGTTLQTITSGFTVTNGVVSYDFTGLGTGSYTVQVKAIINGKSSESTSSSEVDILDCLVSDKISVEGFQIKTNDSTSQIAFRTICKAPNVGSTISVDSNDYTVTSIGTIYTCDSNTSGYSADSVLDKKYTILNTEPVSAEVESQSGYRYKGYREYNNQVCTYGYVATDSGILSGWNSSDKSNTYYVRTMNNMNSLMTNTLHVRAFVVATNTAGTSVLIYGTTAANMSVAEVANYIYCNSLSANYAGHDYLYNNILNSISTTNPYYLNSTLSYGWNDNLYTPGK